MGRWLRILWLTLWAASLVAVIAATAFTVATSGRITPAAVALVVAASTALYVVVDALALPPQRPRS
jgi:hypothetical protein